MVTHEKPILNTLPESTQNSISIFGFDAIEYSFNQDTGQPQSFIRYLIRKIMADKGKIPPDQEPPSDSEE